MALQSKISKPRARPESEQCLDAALAICGSAHCYPTTIGNDCRRLPGSGFKRLADGRTAIYVARSSRSALAGLGWWLAQIARLIGGPLPISTDTHVPSIVTVTEDAATSGQVWTRIYAPRNGFPRSFTPRTRFAGQTGLRNISASVSALRCGLLSMAMDLLFRSAGYLCRSGPLKIFRLPAFPHAGALTVDPIPILAAESFNSPLEILHPRFGMLVRQSAVFMEATP